jgi:hypothetical protein
MPCRGESWVFRVRPKTAQTALHGFLGLGFEIKPEFSGSGYLIKP